jgi:hypothetical protein
LLGDFEAPVALSGSPDKQQRHRNTRVGNTSISGGEPGGTSGSIHGLGYLFSALRRERLIAEKCNCNIAYRRPSK